MLARAAGFTWAFVLLLEMGCGGEVTKSPGEGVGGSAANASTGGTTAMGGSGGTRAVLAAGCVLNSDCDAPLGCAFRRCHTLCESSRDCPEGQRCMTSDRPFQVCQLPDERACSDNSDCPESQICATDGQCREECVTDRDCVTGQTCVLGTCGD